METTEERKYLTNIVGIAPVKEQVSLYLDIYHSTGYFRNLLLVGGKGTVSNDGQKERFLFTATFENNRDGTVAVRYEASRPDASFVIPRVPGRFEISRRR